MRQVTANAVNAFLNHNASSHGNTAVVNYPDRTELQLHGNTIAKLCGNTLYITFAGYPTKTTKERLNGLFNIRYGTRPFYVKQHVLHYDDNPIDDDTWYRVVDGGLARVAREDTRVNQRIADLTDDIYNAVFATVDGEPEYTGDEAGEIAYQTSKLFCMLCNGMDVTLMTAGSE
jgi:hypothetical protein